MSNPLSRAWNWLRQWFTVSDKRPVVGRNELCWCGSGKKYKHCHMDGDRRRGTLPTNTTPRIQREMMERTMRRMEKTKARAGRKR